jgi:AcrR family transcriptional regulator
VAREKDEAKRLSILASAKRLFAERGFHGVSVSDLAQEVDLPVGSIYTYFESKEAIVATVIEEGWAAFIASLEAALSGPGGPDERLSIFLYRFLPKLFADVDFISIVLDEAGKSFGLKDKLERLASLVSGLVTELAVERGLGMDFPLERAKTAIVVYFLGSIEALRLGRSAGIDIGPEDAIDFIRLSIERGFGVEIIKPV